jgi:ribosomal protein S27E
MWYNRVGGEEMPNVGEIKRGYQIGIKTHTWYIYYKCNVCGYEGWKQAVGNPLHPRFPNCKVCVGKESAKKSPHYREDGVIYHKSSNRTWLRLEPDDPYYPMTYHYGYVLRARLVMARHLGRCLTSDEIVHHKNLNTNDDELDNLKLCKGIGEHMSQQEHHKRYTHTDDEFPVLQKSGKLTWYVKEKCIDCGKERLVPKHNHSHRCSSCATKKMHRECGRGGGYGNWKGGITLT